MAEDFQLRAYCYLDRMQPQFASFVGSITQGDLPIEGMASLDVEMAPGNWVFRVVDIAVKATDAKPGAQIVEREFGMFEVHSPSQSDVLRAGETVLAELGLEVGDRQRPEIASMQIITNVDPYQAQLLNRFTRGMMLVAGQTMLVLECAPAAYINLAANEAEKAASVNLMHVTSVGRFGRLWMAGTEADILAARDAAVNAIESLQGRSLQGKG
jgi:ethanolamine utilization microcompartment shell protein EutL